MDERQRIIQRICKEIGVSDGYYDVWGKWHPTSMATKEAIVKAIGMPVNSAKALLDAYRTWIIEKYSNVLDRTIVLEAPAEALPVRLVEVPDRTMKLTITKEDGENFCFELSAEAIKLRTRKIEWTEFYEGMLKLPEILDEGYYKVRLEMRNKVVNASLMVTPEKAYLELNKRGWGLNLCLYALHSQRTQGIGDLGALKTLSQWISEQGGMFLLITPIHYNDAKGAPGRSPYYPLSRLFFNPLYIDITSLPWTENEQLYPLKRLQDELYIDYDRLFELKDNLLRKAFEKFLKDEVAINRFQNFVVSQGKLLEEFARYVSERKDAVDEKELLYQKFLQWCIYEQIQTLPRGVFFDLALGTREDGFDSRAFPCAFAKGISVGAPPDDFSPKGQDWGFPPLSPLHLQETGFQYFAELLKRNIPARGGVRIDHIAGLQRQFWIPKGATAKEGTYVYYPLNELLGLICLESRRKEAVVIGEDLGTVEPALRDTIKNRNILSFRVFYFEQESGRYKKPEEYPEKALVTTTTHDLPTLWGFYSSQDIKDRLKLNRYPDRSFYEKDLIQRKKDIELIRKALKAEGLLDKNTDETLSLDELIAIYKYLWKSPCLLMAFQMDDLLMVVHQQNIPGTIEEYPNWQRRYPYKLEKALRIIEDLIKRVLKNDKGFGNEET